MAHNNKDIACTTITPDGVKTQNVVKGREVLFIVEGVRWHIIWSLVPCKPPFSAPGTHDLPVEIRIDGAEGLTEQHLNDYEFGGLPGYLQPGSHQIHIVVSTKSGTGLAPEFFTKVLDRVLRIANLYVHRSCALVTTESADSIKQFTESVLLRNANNGVKQTVILLSGDGGVFDIVNNLTRPDVLRSESYIKPVLCLLPLGTANALFHSLHRHSPIPSPFLKALRTLFHGTPRPLPLFQVRFSPGAYILSHEGRITTPIPSHTLHGAVVASYGLHSSLVAESDNASYRLHGEKRFVMVAEDLLSGPGGPHAYRADVTLLKSSGEEKKVERKEHGFILAALVSNLQDTFMISPRNQPLDGQLRVVHFGPMGGEKTMAVLMEANQRGKHVERQEVAYEDVGGMRVQFNEEGEDPKWRRCCIDGVIVAVEEGGWMEVKTLKNNDVVDVVVDF